jgi:transcriptional regulator with XRE-family HTH domain
VSSTVEGRAGLAEELRRRRTALGWTLEQVAAQAQVSVGTLSLIETGKRRPSIRSWERIRGALGISEPLPEEAWQQLPREISDQLVATLGACLAAVGQASLAELAQAVGAPIPDVRLALRGLAEQLEPAGMQVLDDGSHIQLAPAKRLHDAVAQLVQPERLPGAVQVAKEDGQSRVDAQLGMLSHLRALVPGQRSAQLVRQGRDGGSDCVADTLGTVPGQGRSVLDSRLAVIFHAGQVQEHGEPRCTLDKYADRGAVQTEDQVSFPVSGNGAVVNLSGPFTDNDLWADELLASAPGPSPRHAECSSGARARCELTAQRAAALNK